MLFGLRENGTLILLDTDEITESAGNAVQLIFSLHDGGGKTSQVEGLVTFAPEYVLKSESLGSNWYESSWFGVFLQMENKWLYHRKLGWLFVHPLGFEGYWFWDSVSQDWWWTDKPFFLGYFQMQNQVGFISI